MPIPSSWPVASWEACTWEAQARALELGAERSRKRDAAAALRLGRGADSAAPRPATWVQLLREAGLSDAEVEAEVAGVVTRATGRAP